MSEITYERMRRTLYDLPRAVGALMTGRPADQTQASRDIQQGGEPANAVRSLMQLAITAASDHVFSLERELTEPVMTISPWTTARGVLETASTAMWLLDGVDFSTRMARGLTLRLQHLEDELVYARDAHRRRPDITNFGEAIPIIEDRMRHLEEIAAGFDIPSKRNKQDLLIGFGGTMPNNTELAEREFGEGGTYRLLSGVAHNRTWAIRALSLRVLGTGVDVEQHLAVEGALFLIVSVIDWFARPVWAYFKYNGLDLDSLVRVFEEQYNQAAIVPTERFWHRETG